MPLGDKYLNLMSVMAIAFQNPSELFDIKFKGTCWRCSLSLPSTMSFFSSLGKFPWQVGISKKYNIHSTIQQISEWYNAQSQVFCAKSSDVGKRQLHYDEAEIISEHIKGTTCGKQKCQVIRLPILRKLLPTTLSLNKPTLPFPQV